MRRSFLKITPSSLLPVLLITTFVVALDYMAAWAQSPGTEMSVHRSISKKEAIDAQKARMNTSSVGLAAGLLEGAPIRLATEMARIVDDGPNLLVLPVVTRGPVENLNALLYLRGIDMAIINSDA